MNHDSSDISVFPPLGDSMTLDFLWDEKGGAWILHDKPLPEILKWVDYDAERGVVTLNMAHGRSQDLGVAIPAKAAKVLAKTVKITVMYMKDGQVEDLAIVPFNNIGGGAY